MPSRRLNGFDAAYLSSEVPGNYLHLMAILTLDPSEMPGGYSFEKLRAFMQERLPLIPPLRRRLVEVPFGIDRPRWIEEEQIDLDLHVRRAAVPSPGGARELSAMAAEIAERPLDRSRPLWEIVVVEGLTGGQVGLIAKLHHAMMDGMVGVRYMALLLGDREVDLREASEESVWATSEPSDLRLLAEALPEVMSRPYRLARVTTRALFSMAAGRVSRLFSDEETAESAEEAASERVVPHSFFNVRTGPYRRIAYTAVDLSTVKAIGRAFDATVNDVVLAMVGAAVRRYLIERDSLPEDSLWAGIPASTHEEGDELANAFTLMFPTLATDLEDPAARLCAIRDSSRREKARARPEGSGGRGGDASGLADIPPPWFYHALARLYVGARLAERMDQPFLNLLVSSVPGPPIPLTFAGAPITGIHPLGPVYDGMSLNITAIGREKSVDIGLVACRDGVPELWSIVEGLEEALAELQRAAEALVASRDEGEEVGAAAV
ncbi:MAG: wax ester/triacylglycerol synthase family O-acyltransferase [Deltaproteobacteria bacterium]|nr:wax ester/triacylglycerol synthase family O-acyltransferase [Deltaproteobacteria bacterium]